MTTPSAYPLERDEILVPTYEGYRKYPILSILGLHHSSLSARAGLGFGSLRFLSSNSPYQHGQSLQGMRWNPKVLQIVINQTYESLIDYWKGRENLLELLRPSRAFLTRDKLVDPFIYRKWLPGGDVIRGSDMEVTNGDSIVYSSTGGFLHRGGLEVGSGITIEGVKYEILVVDNDFELELTPSYSGSTSTNASFNYTQNPRYRDIFFIMESGPRYNQSQSAQVVPFGFIEALRLRCHDPFWRGVQQRRIWTLPESIGDLIFDDEGAWFGTAGLTGRWLYAPEYVSRNIGVVYYGHEISRPAIFISGPADLPSITNLTTGIKLNMEYNIAEGEQVEMNINTLTVTNNQGDNLLGYLRGNLSGFGLVPEPAAPGGINTINVTFGGATEVSSARIEWQNVYAGI